jgi:hypothetical protein
VGNGVANSVSLLLVPRNDFLRIRDEHVSHKGDVYIHIDGCLEDRLRRRVENNKSNGLRRGFTLGRLDWLPGTNVNGAFAGQERGSRLLVLNQPTGSSGKPSAQPIPRFAEALDFPTSAPGHALPLRGQSKSNTYNVLPMSSLILGDSTAGPVGLIQGPLGFGKRRPPWSISRPPGWFHVLTFSAETRVSSDIRLTVPK